VITRSQLDLALGGHQYSSMLSRRQVEFLLHDLCVIYGLCLAPTEWDRLLAETPSDPESFALAIFRAEGMEPAPSWRELYRKVLARVQAAYERAGPPAT